MKKLLIGTALLVVVGIGAATAVVAESPAIAQRQDILKSFGKTTKPVGEMLRGERSFDLATVQVALKTIVDGTKKLPDLFPDDSKTGHDTEALPKIWEDKAEFVSHYKKLGHDAEVASAAITDEASLKAQMPKVFGNCKYCHDNYRAKKK